MKSLLANHCLLLSPPPTPLTQGIFLLVSTWFLLINRRSRNPPRFYHWLITHWVSRGPSLPSGPLLGQQEQPTSSQARRGSASPGPALHVIWPLAPLLSTPSNTPVPWLQASGHTTIQASLLSDSFPSSFCPVRASSFSFPSLHGNTLPHQLNCIISRPFTRPHSPTTGWILRSSVHWSKSYLFAHDFPILTSRHWSSLYASTCSFPDFPTSFPLLTLCSPPVCRACRKAVHLIKTGKGGQGQDHWLAHWVNFKSPYETVQETRVRSLGWKDPWRRERLPILVFWPGEFHGLYSPRGHKEPDRMEPLSLYFMKL